MVHRCEQLQKAGALGNLLSAGVAADSHQRAPGRIVHRDAQVHSGTLNRRELTALDGSAQIRIEPIPTSNDIDANGLIEATSRLREQVASQQPHQRMNFCRRPMPIVR